jgi:DDE superfamily endonuclease/Transposase
VSKNQCSRRKKSEDIAKEFNEGLATQISSATIRRRLNDLGYHYKEAICKPFLKPDQAARRLKWCMEKRNWKSDEWIRIVWSDETSFELGKRGAIKVWRKDNEKYHKDCIHGTVKSGRITQMYWGAFCGISKGHLVAVNGRMDSEAYISVCTNHLLPFIRGNNLGSDGVIAEGINWKFMQDNAPCHSSRRTLGWMKENGIELLEWPPQSPDLNPMENLWAILKRDIQKKQPKNVCELDKFVQGAWEGINLEYLINLIESMPTRIKMAIEAKGYSIPY